MRKCKYKYAFSHIFLERTMEKQRGCPLKNKSPYFFFHIEVWNKFPCFETKSTTLLVQRVRWQNKCVYFFVKEREFLSPFLPQRCFLVLVVQFSPLTNRRVKKCQGWNLPLLLPPPHFFESPVTANFFSTVCGGGSGGEGRRRPVTRVESLRELMVTENPVTDVL